MDRGLNFDFSDINLQYLLRTRDLARHDPEVIAALQGISIDIVQTLTRITPEELVPITRIKPPLVVPRQDSWWWARLLTALRHGQTGEIDAIIEHAMLITSSQPWSGRAG